MLSLAGIRDWLKIQFPNSENFYIGRLENKKEKSLGVYSLNRVKDIPLICLGGREYNACEVKDVSILLHWTKNANETEIAAQQLFDKLLNLNGSEIYIEDKKINIIELLVSEPVDVGTTSDVYERVIEVRFYYN